MNISRSDLSCDRYTQALDRAGITDRPVVVVDLDAFDRNANDIARRAGGLPVRVASKSIRVTSLVKRAAARFNYGVLAYSIHEALNLVDAGLTDVVVAYPSASANGLRRLAENPKYRESVTLMIDSIAHAELISHVCAPFLGQESIRVAIELDCAFQPISRVHLGALRSPLFTPGEIGALADALLRFPHIRVVGLMGYESQIAGTPNGGRSLTRFAIQGLQALSSNEVNARRAEAVVELRKRFDLEFVNGGGTGSIEATSKDSSVSEVAAGSGLIGPATFDHFSHFRPEPALFMGFEVVRRPARNVATILGGGWIASGPHGADRSPSPVWPSGLTFSSLEGAGEVQTPLIGEAAQSLSIGDTVWFRHAKSGEPAEHVNEYALYSEGEIVDLVPTYRGEGHAYL